MKHRLEVIVGGQYGSESKGRVCADRAMVARNEGYSVTGVRVAGPNAGHVVIDQKGLRFALRQVPVAMAVDPFAIGLIAAGSEVDYEVLLAEVDDLERGGHHIRHRLLVDGEATLLESHHREAEGGNGGQLQQRIGSTGKGIGAARADRIWRQARRVKDELRPLIDAGIQTTNTARYLTALLSDGELTRQAVQIEGTQGYGLGLHAGHYPQCTSSDCRAIDFLSMAGLSPWGLQADLDIWVVLRVYPIRVAGNSGPLKGETSWSELGLPEEHTTVTHKVRRVGEWDSRLAAEAVRANGGSHVKIALAMVDQRFPTINGTTTNQQAIDKMTTAEFEAVTEFIDRVESETGARVWSLGTGPDTTINRELRTL